MLPVRRRSATAWSATKAVQPGSAAVVMEMDVPAGKPTTLVTEFLDDEDNVLAGAYYVYIRRADGADGDGEVTN